MTDSPAADPDEVAADAEEAAAAALLASLRRRSRAALGDVMDTDDG